MAKTCQVAAGEALVIAPTMVKAYWTTVMRYWESNSITFETCQWCNFEPSGEAECIHTGMRLESF